MTYLLSMIIVASATVVVWVSYRIGRRLYRGTSEPATSVSEEGNVAVYHRYGDAELEEMVTKVLDGIAHTETAAAEVVPPDCRYEYTLTEVKKPRKKAKRKVKSKTGRAKSIRQKPTRS